jgi:hypothetical protein
MVFKRRRILVVGRYICTLENEQETSVAVVGKDVGASLFERK